MKPMPIDPDRVVMGMRQRGDRWCTSEMLAALVCIAVVFVPVIAVSLAFNAHPIRVVAAGLMAVAIATGIAP